MVVCVRFVPVLFVRFVVVVRVCFVLLVSCVRLVLHDDPHVR